MGIGYVIVIIGIIITAPFLLFAFMKSIFYQLVEEADHMENILFLHGLKMAGLS